jgi:hypothetical protein
VSAAQKYTLPSIFAANLPYRIEWLDNATVAPTFNSSLADSHVHLYADFVTSADMSHKWLYKVGLS